ncbi:MAG: hypothetical protein ACI4Q3_03225 [Kiritimatiellia bacterium]
MNARLLPFALSVLAALSLSGQTANPFRHKVALIAGFGEGSDKAASVRTFAAAYADSHAAQFAFASKTRPGADRFRVLDASGTVVYEGGDDREAEAAVVNALTEMPVPGQLINGVELKKFKHLQRSFVMGKVKAEGAGLAPFKAALKSKKPGEAEEAQAILDSIRTAKENLEQWIAEDLQAGDKGAALRDLNWFRKTWPSEKAKYEADFKRLSADPEAVKAYKELTAPPRKRRSKVETGSLK